MKQFIIEQKVTMLANQYSVFSADSAGNKGQLLAFAHQKRLAFREKFELFSDDTRTTVLFTVQARQVFDLGARYEVRDAENVALGTLGKNFKASLLRSTWQIFRPGLEDQPVFIAQERNKTLAVVRRVWELLPYISDIPFFVKYHFEFLEPQTLSVKGSFEKTTNFRDHYALSLEDDTFETVDWRVFIALGIMMDALQSR